MREPREGARIVVGLKSESRIDVSVETAAIMAVAIKAEIFGLFVREDAMVDLADLPFASALSVGARKPMSLSRASMETAFNRCEGLCRRVLSQRAQQAEVKWSFHSTRGELPTHIRKILDPGDFLVLSRASRGPGGHRGLIEDIRGAADGVRGIVIAPARASDPKPGPVIVVDDGSEAGADRVGLAMQIAGVTGAQPVLFVVAPTHADAGRIISRGQQLCPRGSDLIVHRFFPGTPDPVVNALVSLAPSFAVLDIANDGRSDDRLTRTLLQAAKTSIVLLRGRDQAD